MTNAWQFTLLQSDDCSTFDEILIELISVPELGFAALSLIGSIKFNSIIDDRNDLELPFSG
jgi:hypothetical protein